MGQIVISSLTIDVPILVSLTTQGDGRFPHQENPLQGIDN